MPDGKDSETFLFFRKSTGSRLSLPLLLYAQSMGLTGWVRNLWDDRVEMEVQGTREEIREMVERLSQQSFVEIEGIEAREIPLEEEFGFHVRG